MLPIFIQHFLCNWLHTKSQIFFLVFCSSTPEDVREECYHFLSIKINSTECIVKFKKLILSWKSLQLRSETILKKCLWLILIKLSFILIACINNAWSTINIFKNMKINNSKNNIGTKQNDKNKRIRQHGFNSVNKIHSHK